MGRPLRIEVAHAAYHVTSRGSNRKLIYAADGDRRLFLRLLALVAAKYEWHVLAYCLMTNHYHLIVRIAEVGLSRGMQWLNGGFSRITNQWHGREAHLFRNRFAARLIESDAHLVGACRYVVLNPVAAGLCARPEDWPWSSYRATAGLEEPPAFLADTELLAEFGPSPKTARRLYRDFVAEGVRDLAAARPGSVSDTVAVL